MPAYDAPPDRTARQRTHAKAETRRNATDITTQQRGFFDGLSAVVALAAAACADRPFFNSAARALAAGRLNINVPIGVGVVLALGMSIFETLQQRTHVYFDFALMLLTLLLVGRTLEQAMRRRTGAAAGNFVAPRAETLTKFVSDTELAKVPAASVEPGDLVLVRPGERIAVDGVIIEGRSEIDQSLVTGETLPVSAAKDGMVYAGTLNVSGTLRVKVITAPPPYPPPAPTLPSPACGGGLGRGAGEGREGERDDVTGMRDRARAARTRYVRLADRAARLYSPLAHAAAFATLLGWVAFGANWHDAGIAAIAVLIITCPCALRLAIPAVQVAASGALFRAGVLLNSGEGIERLAGVDTILFDKTGTLTLPEPEVINAADIPPERLALAGRLALA